MSNRKRLIFLTVFLVLLTGSGMAQVSVDGFEAENVNVRWDSVQQEFILNNSYIQEDFTPRQIYVPSKLKDTISDFSWSVSTWGDGGTSSYTIQYKTVYEDNSYENESDDIRRLLGGDSNADSNYPANQFISSDDSYHAAEDNQIGTVFSNDIVDQGSYGKGKDTTAFNVTWDIEVENVNNYVVINYDLLYDEENSNSTNTVWSTQDVYKAGERPDKFPISTAYTNTLSEDGELKQGLTTVPDNRHGDSHEVTVVTAYPGQYSFDSFTAGSISFQEVQDAGMWYDEAENQIIENNMSEDLLVNDKAGYEFKAYNLTLPEDSAPKLTSEIVTGSNEAVDGLKMYVIGSIAGTTTYSTIVETKGNETFEDGDISDWEGSSSSQAGVTTDVVANGQYSGYVQTSSGSNYNIVKTFPSKQAPSSINFWQQHTTKSTYEDTEITYRLDNNPVLQSHLTCTGGGCGSNEGAPGQIVVNGVDTGVSYNANQWYFIELENIDWENNQVGEVYVDGNLQIQDVPFETQVDGVDDIQIRTYGTGTDYGYYDDITLPGVPPEINEINSNPSQWRVNKYFDWNVSVNSTSTSTIDGVYARMYKQENPVKDWVKADNLTATKYYGLDNFYKPTEDVNYTLSIKVNETDGDAEISNTTQTVIYRAPETLLENPADGATEANPVKFEYTPTCYPNGGCTSSSLFINYTRNVSYRSADSTQSDWQEGSFDNTVATDDGNLVLGQVVTDPGEAGSETGLNNDEWQTVGLQSSYYDSTPIVFTTTATTNGGQDPSSAHVRSVTQSSFETQHCEVESYFCQNHNQETHSWLAVDPQKVQNSIGMDAGTVSISGADTATVTFNEEFSNTPYVYTEVQTNNGGLPINSKVTSRTTSSVDIKLCEQDSTDGCNFGHVSETVGYIAIDPTAAAKSDVFDWGSVSHDYDAWQSVSFSTSYSTSPAVIAETQTLNGQEDIYAEVDNIGTSGADVRFCEHDGGNNCGSHPTEEVAWLSISPGVIEVGKEYRSEGSYNSTEIDAGQPSYWSESDLSVNTPSGTSYDISYAENSTGTWQYYNSFPTDVESRFFKYNISLSTSDTSVTPEINYVNLSYDSEEEVWESVKSNQSKVVNDSVNSIDFDFLNLPDHPDNNLPNTFDWNVKVEQSDGQTGFADQNRTVTVEEGDAGDTTPPDYFDFSLNDTVVNTGDAVNASSEWVDNQEMNYTVLAVNESGTLENTTKYFANFENGSYDKSSWTGDTGSLSRVQVGGAGFGNYVGELSGSGTAVNRSIQLDASDKLQFHAHIGSGLTGTSPVPEYRFYNSTNGFIGKLYWMDPAELETQSTDSGDGGKCDDSAELHWSSPNAADAIVYEDCLDDGIGNAYVWMEWYSSNNTVDIEPSFKPGDNTYGQNTVNYDTAAFDSVETFEFYNGDGSSGFYFDQPGYVKEYNSTLNSNLSDLIYNVPDFDGYLGLQTWGVDSSGNWNSTGTLDLKVDNPPVIEVVSSQPSTKYVSQSFTVESNVTDYFGLGQDSGQDNVSVNLYDADGNKVVEDVLMNDDAGIDKQFSYSFNPADNSSSIGTWTAQVVAEDNIGQLTTQNHSFTVQDDVLPYFKNVSTDFDEGTSELNVTGYIRDNQTGVNKAYLSVDEGQTGTFSNKTNYEDVVYTDSSNNLKRIDSQGISGDLGIDSNSTGSIVDIDGDNRREVIYVDSSTGEIKYKEYGETSVGIGVNAYKVGYVGDIDGDSDLDIPFIDNNDNLKWTDINGNVNDTGQQAQDIGGIGYFTYNILDGLTDVGIVYVTTGGDLAAASGSNNKNMGVGASSAGGTGDFDNDGEKEAAYVNSTGYVKTHQLSGASGADSNVGVNGSTVGEVDAVQGTNGFQILYSNQSDQLGLVNKTGYSTNLGVTANDTGGIGDWYPDMTTQYYNHPVSQWVKYSRVYEVPQGVNSLDYKIWANDKQNNWNSSTTRTVQTTSDTNPPNWFNLGDGVLDDYIGEGESLNISAKWNDSSSNVVTAKLAVNESGTFQNVTTKSYSSQEIVSYFDWSSTTFSGVLGYKIYAEDVAGNWNVTDVGTQNVDNTHPDWFNLQDNGPSNLDNHLEISSEWEDSNSEDSGVREAVLATNESGTLQNYTGSFDLGTSERTGQERNFNWEPRDMQVIGNGRKMLILDVDDNLREFTCSTPGDLSTCNQVSNTQTGGLSFKFTPSGDKYIRLYTEFRGDGPNLVYLNESSCSTAFDVNSCSQTTYINITEKLSGAYSEFDFGLNGNNLVLGGYDSEGLAAGMYCSSSYSLDTCEVTGETNSFGNQGFDQIHWSSGGNNLYSTSYGQGIYQFSCGTSYDVSSCGSYYGTEYTKFADSRTYGLNENGTRLYDFNDSTTYNDNSDIVEYSIGDYGSPVFFRDSTQRVKSVFEWSKSGFEGTLDYQISGTDAVGNSNTTDVGSTVIDTTLPVSKNFTSNGTPVIDAGDTIYLSSWFKDERTGITEVKLASNASGTWQNVTGKTASFTASPGTWRNGNFTYDTSGLSGGVIGFRMWGVDEAGNWNTTEEDKPVEIWINVTTWGELDSVRDDKARYYKLKNDLTSKTTGYDTYTSSNANSGNGWNPIGAYLNSFTGVFEGDNHTIEDLYISRSSTSDVGLFGSLNSAEVRNVGLVDLNIAASDGRVGGIAGRADTSTLKYVYVQGDINAGGNFVGGLVGSTTDTPIDTSFSLGTISASRHVGGIGGSSGNEIVDTFSRMNVSVVDGYAGGLEGESNSALTDVYSTGLVQSNTDSNVGGLVGRLTGGGASDAYWDVNTSNQDASAQGTGLETPEMTYPNSSTYMNFDFSNTWVSYEGVNDGYPIQERYCSTQLFCNPVFENSSVSPNPLIVGSPFDVYYNITDPDGSIENVTLRMYRDGALQKQESFIYSASNVEDTQVDWYTPTQKGEYELNITAEDNLGGVTTESVNIFNRYNESATQQASFTSLISRNLRLNMTPFQDISVTSIMGDALMFDEEVLQDVSLQDSLGVFGNYSRSLSNQVAITDSIDIVRVIDESISDQIAFTDAVSRNASTGRTVQQDISIQDVMSRNASIEFFTQDQFNILQDMDRVRIIPTSPSQTIQVLEQAEVLSFDTSRQPVQAVDIAQAVESEFNTSQSFSDTVDILEDYSRVKTQFRNTTQLLDIQSNVDGSNITFIRIQDRDIQVTETAARTLDLGRETIQSVMLEGTAAENIFYSESPVQQIQVAAATNILNLDFTPSVSQNIQVSSQVDRVVDLARQPVQGVSVFGDVERTLSFTSYLTQQVGVSDFLFGNAKPEIEHVQVRVTELGNGRDVKLVVDARDPDGLNDRAELNFNSYSKEIPAGTGRNVTLDISDSRSNSGTVTVVDESGDYDNYGIEYEFTDKGLKQDEGYSSNLSTQKVYGNDTFNNTGITDITGNISYAEYSASSTVNTTYTEELMPGEGFIMDTSLTGDFLEETGKWKTDPEEYNSVSNQTIIRSLNVSTTIDYLDWTGVYVSNVTVPSGFAPCSSCGVQIIDVPSSGYSNERQRSTDGDGISDNYVQDIEDVVLGIRDEYWRQYRYENITSRVKFRDIHANVTLDDSRYEYEEFVRVLKDNTWNNSVTPPERASCNSRNPDLKEFDVGGETWSACSKDVDGVNGSEYFKVKIPEFSTHQVRFGGFDVPPEEAVFTYKLGYPCPDDLQGDEVGANRSYVCHNNLVMRPEQAELQERDVSRQLGQGVSGVLYVLAFLVAIVAVFYREKIVEETDEFLPGI